MLLLIEKQKSKIKIHYVIIFIFNVNVVRKTHNTNANIPENIVYER